MNQLEKWSMLWALTKALLALCGFVFFVFMMHATTERKADLAQEHKAAMDAIGLCCPCTNP